MKNKIVIMLAVCVLIFSCAPVIPEKDASRITIGIWSEFPDIPKYIKKRTFVFRHQITEYETRDFKQVLTQKTREYLESKGYNVVEVQDRIALDHGRADMIVRILPLGIQKQEGTLGYGFYDRKFLEFVIKQPAQAYVCMNMTLYKKATSKVRRTGRQENFSRLNITELPDSPDQLTEEQKKKMSLKLEEIITKTVFNALPILGL